MASSGIMAEHKGSLSNVGRRRLFLGVAFAILVAPNAVLVLCFGLAGSSGNGLFTGALLAIATAGVGLLCFRRDIVCMKFSCIKLTEVHNSVLQAAAFGWLGGSLLLALIIVAGGSLLPLARYDDASRLVLCSLALVFLLSLAHGRISMDGVLFAMPGGAVGLRQTVRATAPAKSAVVE